MKSINLYLSILLILFSINNYAQDVLVAELSGNPISYNGWSLISNQPVTNEVVLTANQTFQSGSIYFSQPYDLNKCKKWKVQFDFRMFDGNQPNLGYGDGLAFWFLSNPPSNFVEGEGLGIPNNSNGLKVCFDTFNNDNSSPNPEIQVYYGIGYQENNPNMLTQYAPTLRKNNYQKAEILWDNGEITISIDGVTILQGNPIPYNGVENITQGYFGFSASTGGATDKHSIKNVKVYIDTIPVEDTSITLNCDPFSNGIQTFDLTSVANQVAIADYYEYYTSLLNAINESNAIDDPTSFENTTPYQQDIFIKVKDINGCYNIARLTLKVESSTILENRSVNVCDENYNGHQIFNLEEIVQEYQVIGNVSFYKNIEDALELTNPIENTTEYQNENPYSEIIFVRIDESQDCYKIITIELNIIEQPQIIALNTSEIYCNVPVLITSQIIKNSQDQLIWTSDVSGFEPIENQEYIWVNKGGNYTLTIINSNGCSTSQTINVLENYNPNPYDIPIQDINIEISGNFFDQNHNVHVLVNDHGNLAFQLDGGRIQSSPYFTNVSVGVHHIEVFNSDECKKGIIQFEVIGYPRYFTPNGDGYHDYWNVFGLDGQNTKISIFDRYGKLLYIMSPNDRGWDGTFKGKALPATDYWFSIERNVNNNIKIYKGHFSLKR